MDRFIRTNGIQLHYLEHPGDGPPIVLLPGLTANAHAFDGLVQAGLSPRFHALALDLRGRGLSDAPQHGYTMADHAADVIGLLDTLDLEQPALAGHSFGGLLTFYLAARYPARISQLIILDAAMSNATPATRAAIQPSLDRLGRVLPSWETYLDAIKQAPYFQGWWDPAIESYYRADVRVNQDGSAQARSRPEVIGAAMDGVIAEDWPTHLAAIRQPTILFQAPGPYGPPGAPPILSAEQARATIERLAGCRYVEVPGNHMTMLYGAGARRFVEEITAFLPEESAKGAGHDE
jgi:pimeloyl-ACP methyl ester carboxylesterase